MAKIPQPDNNLSELIYKAIKDNHKSGVRYHLGASEIGHPCVRWLWLSFRWALKSDFDGRILRLFRRGQDEELPVLNDLRLAGCEIKETNGKQDYVSIIPHHGGSMDGVILSGVPEAPKKPHVLEIKTHSLKSFNDLEKHGVKKSKPLHYAQMQTYMKGTGIDRALYFAVCKDDDRIYTERVKYDVTFANALTTKAERIIKDRRMPEPLSTDPSWFECKFCDAHAFCHGNEKEKIQTSCRTCEFSSTEDDGWFCNLHEDFIPKEYQLIGCDKYERHGDLC